jgi:hypothetical protein
MSPGLTWLDAHNEAVRLLDDHRKVAICARAGGWSREDMVGFGAAADIVRDLLLVNRGEECAAERKAKG